MYHTISSKVAPQAPSILPKSGAGAIAFHLRPCLVYNSKTFITRTSFFTKNKDFSFFSMTMGSLIRWSYCFFNPIMEIPNISVHTGTSGSGASASITNNSELYVGLKSTHLTGRRKLFYFVFWFDFKILLVY